MTRRTASGTAARESGGSIVGADGRTLRLTAEDVELEPRAWWTSPATGIRYPVEWRLHAPAHELDLAVEPMLANQEVNLSVRYWEGAVRVTSLDPTVPISGRGYLELAGYERD